MTLQELYTKKGELVTTIEVAQAKLQSVNQEIVKRINEKANEQTNDTETKNA